MYAALTGELFMTSKTERDYRVLESKIAEKYKTQGFEVVLQPKKEDLPFDLGTYRPDLIAKKTPNECYIIEVKGSTSLTSIDRYREIAEIVAQHAGWSFLLVTGDDIYLSEKKKTTTDYSLWSKCINAKHRHKGSYLWENSKEPFYLYGEY